MVFQTRSALLALCAFLFVASIIVVCQWLLLPKILHRSDSAIAPVQLPQPTEQPPVYDGQNDTSQMHVPYQQHIVATKNPERVWYEIPEFGVRMQLDRTFAEDLIYICEEDAGDECGDVVFSTISVTNIDPSCSPERGGLQGRLFKSSATIKEIAKEDEYLQAHLDRYIQAGKYFFEWAPSQDVCWKSENEQRVRSVYSIEDIDSGRYDIRLGLSGLTPIP